MVPAAMENGEKPAENPRKKTDQVIKRDVRKREQQKY
jgi:hypothetical protein